MGLSTLDLLSRVDSFPYESDSEYSIFKDKVYTLIADIGGSIGILLPYVVEALEEDFSNDNYFIFDHVKRTVTISSVLNTVDKRTHAFNIISNTWRKNKKFDNALEGWREEKYAIYNPSKKLYMLIERVASFLFGFITYGVHLIGYIPASKSNDSELKVVVAKRSSTKQTWPGLLDNTVAGGLGYPYNAIETVAKECSEEAGLDEEFVYKNAKQTGVLSYIFQSSSSIESAVQPEVEYTYDLELTEEQVINLRPVDGEVERFIIMSVEQLQLEMSKGNFKPNTALCFIDFLIRHGFITAENEPNFVEIVSRSHRKLPYATR